MCEWLYQGHSITEDDLEGYKAFCYIITNLVDGRKYYGKKKLFFTSHKRKKDRKNRIKIIKESDWKEYYGSSAELLRDVERLGSENFHREILKLCKTLSEANYYELKYQMENDVLHRPHEYYNAYVGGRISRKQLGVHND